MWPKSTNTTWPDSQYGTTQVPARDSYHDVVRQLLQADGWRITHDPYRITAGRKTLFVDLGAEEVFAAERDGKRIAVEVKGFGGQSEVRDLEQALGQYLLYLPFLRHQAPDRLLYLAVPSEAYGNLFEEPIGQELIVEYSLKLIVFDPIREELLLWIPKP